MVERSDVTLVLHIHDKICHLFTDITPVLYITLLTRYKHYTALTDISHSNTMWYQHRDRNTCHKDKAHVICKKTGTQCTCTQWLSYKGIQILNDRSSRWIIYYFRHVKPNILSLYARLTYSPIVSIFNKSAIDILLMLSLSWQGNTVFVLHDTTQTITSRECPHFLPPIVTYAQLLDGLILNDFCCWISRETHTSNS